MKHWTLYSLSVVLMFAASAFGQTNPQPQHTADVLVWNKPPVPVVDCAVFMPALDSVYGRGATAEITESLLQKGYRAQIIFALTVLESSQGDSAAHKVEMFETNIDRKKLVRYGRDSLYFTLTGIRSALDKKHKFSLRLHKIGKVEEIVKTVAQGTIGLPEINLSSLPKCQERKRK